MNVGAAVGNAKEQKHASEDIRQYRLKSSRLKPQTRGQTQEDGFTRLIIGMINDNQELFDVNGSKPRRGGQKQGLRRCRTKAAHCLWVTTKRCLPLWVKTMGGAPMLVQKYMIPSAAESEVRTATV